ncbi:hypothetical protein WS71_03055 [Burkholderia mayonis]|uniref:Inclusion body protein n=2 Tax=Burkholderia mayonis TaxID=1385591 RepID=A0A1B4FWJ6_9BURK|nr:hypothetical protein WS71_03055 [Burkholderia mayonis]KVE51781.1 hypothetical protein WS71_11390 [Burkholderia mayonis]
MAEPNQPADEPARCSDVLVIADVATLLDAYPDASLDLDAPTPVDGKYLYVMYGGIEQALGRNDSRIVAPLSPGDALHLRESALSLYGEKRVLFYRMTPADMGVVGPIELQMRESTVVVPNPDDPTQPGAQDLTEHFWRVPLAAAGSTDCEADFMIADRTCAPLAYFTWQVRIEVLGDTSPA